MILRDDKDGMFSYLRADAKTQAGPERRLSCCCCFYCNLLLIVQKPADALAFLVTEMEHFTSRP